MAEPGEAVSRELEVVDEGEPLLCARRLAQALPVLTWSAGQTRIDTPQNASLHQTWSLRFSLACSAFLYFSLRMSRAYAVNLLLRVLRWPAWPPQHRPPLARERTLRLLSCAKSLCLTRCHPTRDAVVDRSSRDVAEAGTRTVALRSSSLSLLLLPHLARSVFNGSFALPRLLYSLDTRTCYASTLTQYDAIKPGEAGSLRAWCADGGFTSALKSCWDQTCGQQQWDAACSYAASTSSMWDQAHSSAAVKVATVPGTTVLPLVTSTAARSALSTATAVAQSDTVHLASSSTSGAAKLVCTSLFALIGAVILAIVVFLEAGPSL
ncbi:hypothetical protein BJY59DRAFT_758512 [Rhodotorula toruloides]